MSAANDSIAFGSVVYQRGENDEDNAEVWDDEALIRAYDKAVSETYKSLDGQKQATGQKPTKSGSAVRDAANGAGASGSATKSKREKRNKRKSAGRFKVGDLCWAFFSEDESQYKARIIAIDSDNETCTVQYVDYGNEEEQNLADLQQYNEADENGTEVGRAAAGGLEDETAVNHRQDFFGHIPSSSNNYSNGAFANGENNDVTYFIPPPVFDFPDNYLPPAAANIPSIPPPPPPTSFDTKNGPVEDTDALVSMLMSWYMSGYHTGYYQALKDKKKK